MPISDYIISILFLIFLTLFIAVGNSPAVQRWLNRVLGAPGREDEQEPEKGPGETPGGVSPQAREYEVIIFEKLALAGKKGLSLAGLADELHFDPPMVAKALASLETKGMIRQSGLLGRKVRLSEKGREHAIQEGIIPRLRSGSGG